MFEIKAVRALLRQPRGLMLIVGYGCKQIITNHWLRPFCVSCLIATHPPQTTHR